MSEDNLIPIACFGNESENKMRLFLEMLGAEVVLSPGQEVELLAEPSEGLLPITCQYSSRGLQIHPNMEFDPHWHVRFKGKLIRAGYPTILDEYE
jgi:hypothetical protein